MENDVRRAAVHELSEPLSECEVAGVRRDVDASAVLSQVLNPRSRGGRVRNHRVGGPAARAGIREERAAHRDEGAARSPLEVDELDKPRAPLAAKQAHDDLLN